MTRHVILAYGRETEYWRAIFAILSFWAWYTGDKAKVRTLIFTDRPDFFKPHLGDLPADYVHLTAEAMQQMRGPQQYVHRIKLATVDQVFRDYPGDQLLFCDSDTFFVAPAEALLERLRPGVSLLHQREFTYAEAVDVYASYKPAQDEYPRRFIELIESQTFQVGGQPRKFLRTQHMWNSGVLALRPEIAALMPDIVALNDAFYAGSGWMTVEQIAFSLALPTQTQLMPSDEFVFHYWGAGQKQLMDRQLAQLFAGPFGRLSLAERLSQVRHLSSEWWHAVKLDQVREGALYALAQGDLVAGLKYVAKALLTSPFDGDFIKSVFTILKKKYA
ncbi:hypothetical protein [uncultured Hymenobacter sp.]|uniref:hypothetical protein n=1 Tax=uncultured Hymenobacter sp. TaxID=170016 RepID=UPI0035C9A63B